MFNVGQKIWLEVAALAGCGSSKTAAIDRISGH